MKRILPLLLLTLAGLAPAALSQGGYSDESDHAEAEIFGNLFCLNDEKINLGGLGGRLGANANGYIQIEGVHGDELHLGEASFEALPAAG